MRLLALGLVPFVALTFFGDVVFHLVLGDAWRLAGTYCGLMGLFYFFRLLSEPLISIYNAQRTEKRLFYFYSTLFALNGAAVWLGTYFFRDPMVIVLLFAGVNTLAYLYLGCAILRNTGLPWIRITARTLLLTLVCGLFFMMLRVLLLHSWLPALQ